MKFVLGKVLGAKLLCGKDYILLPPCLPHVSVPTCLSSMTIAAKTVYTPLDVFQLFDKVIVHEVSWIAP
jgi:hypothetical protein